MNTGPGNPTLDQLNVLVEVVEAGSFTGAARKLNRALSVISYTISNLEAQLGVPLFDRTKSRRPVLTTEGRMVLAEARSVVGGISALRAKVAGMMNGLEGELHVVLDSLLPSDRVVEALKAFCAEFPSTTLNLHIETLGAVAHMVLEKTATVGIAGPYADYSELTRINVGLVRMVPVAGRHHALATGVEDGAAGASRDHVQLVVYDRSDRTKGKDFSVSANRTWRLADLSAKHALLRGGIGWGMMPLAMVRDDIASGLLVELDLPDRRAFDYPIDAIYRTDTPPGPAACWLIERFRAQQAG